MANENLNKWNRTFKKVGTKAGSLGVDVLRNIAPGISSTVDSSTDVLRESKQFILRSKSQIQQYQRTLKNTKMGKDSINVLNDAFNDIKNGVYSLNKSSDDLYDSMDDYNDSFSKYDLDESDPTSIAMVESTKNMAIIGRTVAEGNAATIEGMRNMTETISSVTIKAAESSVGKLSNIALNGISQTNFYLNGINNRLDAINENIISLIDFQRNVTYQTNQASIEYYSESSRMMQQMGQAVSEMQDYIKSQKELEKKKKTSDNGFDVSNGFNVKDYAKFVKKNFDNSSVGMMLGMASMGASMMGAMGESPLSMVMPMIAENLVPKNIRKSIQRFDKSFTSSVDTILYNIGDMANSTDFLKSTIGTLFGKKREKFGKTNLSDFKKENMGWNGIAQKTLVTVIPSYLANIEAALTKSDSRHYDMDSGMFITKKDLTKEFQDNFKMTQESSMNMFADELRKVLDKSSMSDIEIQKIKNIIDETTYQQLMGTGGSRKDATRRIFDSLNNKVSDTELRDVLMEWQNGMTTMISEMNNLMKVSGTKNEVLFNEKGKSTEHLYRRGNISNYHKYITVDGRQFDVTDMDESSTEYLQYLSEHDKSNQAKTFKRKAIDKVRRALNLPERDPSTRRHIISDGIDYGANKMFDVANGLSSRSRTNINTQSSNTVGRASSQARPSSNGSGSSATISSRNNTMSRNVREEADRITRSASLENTLSLTPDQIQADSRRINNEIANDEATDNQSVLTKLVMSLQTNVLNPLVGGLFGKGGFFKSLFDNEHVKKVKDTLFNEETGIFKDVTLYMKDQIAAIKHVFTGKGYTDSQGVIHEEDTNSVFDHFAKGYDFVFKNAMSHIFGEDFKDNETYNKYLKFFDFKGKRDKKREDRLAREEEEKKQSNIAAATGYYDENHNFVSPEKHSAQIQKSINRHQKKMEKMKSITAQTVDSEKVLSDAVTYSSDKIKSTTDRMTSAMFGDFADDKKTDQAVKSTNKSFSDSIKQKLPKGLAIAGAGALGGAILGIGGAGIIGSLFLPTGLVGGAIVASGLAIASKSEGIKKFLFGEEDDNGKKMGGLISNKTQEFVKKNMPMIVGGGALGIVKNLILGSSGGVLGTLIGGPLAGAAFSVGLGLLKQNDAVNNILFGKDNGDGKKTNSAFTKSSEAIKKVMEKSGNFVKGGLKGLGAGLLTGAVVSQMGVLGSALTVGGPIGMGIAGLGIGIASQTNKFNELLFGTKEFDENGDYKGRAGDGLLTRVRNLLVVNVFDPIKDNIQNNAIDFAIWAKEKIEFPFRLAFGPILDSISGIHKNVTETVHDVFNNVGESVTKAMKKGIDKVFRPITSVMGKVAKGIGFVAKQGVKLSMLPITAPLKFLEILTAPKRKKEQFKQKLNVFSNFGTILDDAKRNTDREYEAGEYGRGIRGGFNYVKNGIKNVKGAWDDATFASNDELKEEGKNHMGWMDVPYEKEQLEKQKKVIKNDRKTWRSINKERQAMLNQQGGATVNYTDDELKRQQKKFAKLGINKNFISNNEDFNMFLTNRTDWEEKFLKPKQGEDTQEAVIKRVAKFGLPDNNETKSYREKVLSKFDLVTKEITKLTAQQYLGSRNEFSLKEIKSMNKRFSALGITWDELGFDPTELVNKADISDADWLRLLYETEEKGGFTSGSFSIRDFLKWQKENKEEYKKYSDEVDAESAESASLNVLNDISESVRASAVANMNQAAMNTGAGETDIESSTGMNLGSKEFKINKIWRKKLAADEAKKREAEEDKKIKSGTKEFENEEAGKAIIDPENATEEQKSSLFSKVGDFFSDMFGGIGSFLNGKKGSALLTAGVIGTALFGEKAVDLVKVVWDKIVPPIVTQLKKAGNWIVKNGPGILDQLEDFVHNNIGTVADFLMGGMARFARIASDVFITIGKKAANKICEKLNIGWVPFKDVESDSTKSFDTFDEAEVVAKEQNKNVYTNPTTGKAEILGENVDIIDPETGETKTIGAGGHLLRHTGATFGRELLLSPTTRTVAKNGTRLLGKVAGTVSGIIPGFKVAKGMYKGGSAILGAGYKGVKSIGGFVKGQFTKKAGEAVIEETLEEGAEKVTKNAAKTMAKETGKNAADKVIAKNAANAASDITEKVAGSVKNEELKGMLKFFREAGDNLKKYAKSDTVTKILPENKFTTLINSFIDWISKKAAKLSGGALSKIADFIEDKTTKATAKTGAAAGTAGMSMLVFAAIDGISGALDAPYLFGVTSDDVDGTMRTISALMYAILGLPVVAYFDILLEVVALITGENPKQKFARWAYSIIKEKFGGENKLEEAAVRIQLETAKYNKANGTNLSTEAYLEKRNAGSGLFGTIGKGFTYVFNNKKYQEKYNFSKYSVSDAEVQKELAKANTESDTFTTSSYDSSDQILVGLGPGRKLKSRLRYNKAIGYGNTLMQGDSRWGNYPIGYFPDGSVSTMATGGCGPTALAMVANEVGYGTSPVSVAQYAKNNGYIKDGGATTGLFTEGASQMGLRSTALSKSSLRTSLQKGESVIVSGKSTSSNSPYTEAGHIVKASGLDSNGNVIVDDPMRGRTSVNVNDLTSGMTNGWSYSVGYGPGNMPSVFENSKNTEVTLNDFANGTKSTQKTTAKKKSPFKTVSKKVVFSNRREEKEYKNLVKKFNRACKTYNSMRAQRMTDNSDSMRALVNSQYDTVQELYSKILELNPNYKLKDIESSAINNGAFSYVDATGKKTNIENFSNGKYMYIQVLTDKQRSRINKIIKGLTEKGQPLQGVNVSNIDALKLQSDGFITTNTTGGIFIQYRNNKYLLPSETQLKKGSKNTQTRTQLMYNAAVDALVKIIKENYITKLSSSYNTIINRALTSDMSIENKITSGYKLNSDGVMNFNTLDFYVGLTVYDLEAMIEKDPSLLTNKDIPLFAKVYEYYTKSSKYKNNKSHKITLAEVTSIAQAAGLDDFFGTFGEVNSYEFKNGFPFFRMNDDRWGDIPWRDSTLRRTGDDIASLAMITSAFGDNIFTPKYIYDNWLKNYPGWYNNRNGLHTGNLFRNGGFNALQSTQINGERLKVSELKNVSSIKSALKARKPVYMTGLRYNGSIFGGNKALGTLSTNSPDAYGTLIGVAANDTHVAVNDPRTTADSTGIFDINLLSSTVQNGSQKLSLVKNAYQISNPDGSGIDGHVDLSTKSGGMSDYVPIDSKDGIFGMISAIIHNVGAIGSHLLNSFGGEYVSIFDDNPIENDVADQTGLDASAFTRIDDFDNTTISALSSINSSISGKKISNVSNSNYTPQQKLAIDRINRDLARNKRLKNITIGKTTSTAGIGYDAFGNKFSGPGIGGGNIDIPIGYGAGDVENLSSLISGNSNELGNIFDEFNAISYAMEAQQFGGDYNAAKNEYYALKRQQEAESETGVAGGINDVQTDATASYDTNPSAYSAAALSGDKKEFVEKVAPGAIKGNEQYGVKASLTLAQGALESGWGKDAIGNNLFGIKAGSGWTGKTQTVSTTEYDSSGRKYTTNAAFRDYNSIEESILDHARLLTNPRYKNVLAAKNYKEACYAVKAAGYATDPNYPSKLINLIESNGFAAYDNMTSANLKAGYGLGKHSRRQKSRALGYGASWLQIVQAVKQAIAATKAGYSQSNYVTINVLGRTLSVRTDCSGFVSACCILYGSLGSVINSTGFCTMQTMSGFTKLSWPGWNSLNVGDILAIDGHVEIYAGKDSNGRSMVYNCGSTSSCNNPGATYPSRSAYTYVWRPNEVGGTESIASNATAPTQANTNTSSNTSTTSSLSGGFWSPIANVINQMTESVSKSASKMLGYGQGQDNPVAFFEDTLDGEILSGYGDRNTSLGREYHRGIDIGAPFGKSILSPISGTLVASGNDVSGYGNYAMIQDKRGNNHLFAHMNKPVGYGVGTKITKNDIIGEIGATGRATGSHLHYEIRRNGNKYSTLNPMNYKYDKELGKSINVSAHNMQSADNIGYGTGNKDIPIYDPESKLNVDVNTKKVEDKLDSLINIMKSWADRDSKSSKAATNVSQITNNNTTVYGPGKKSTSSTTKTNNTSVDLRSKSLENIHKAIASK